MAEIIRIPQLGLSDYGELVSWEVEVGDVVSEGDIIAVLESDKASADIESPDDGVLLDTYITEGEEIAIEVGKPLGAVGEEEETARSPDELGAEDGHEGAAADEEERVSEPGTSGGSQDADDSQPTNAKATPRAKRRAEEEGINLGGVEGTGPQGAITTDDVDRYLEASDNGGLTVVESRELSGVRKTIADRLSRSAREKPHVMGTREISIEQLQRVRDRLAGAYDVDVSLNDLFLYFVGEVLADLPAFNAHFENGRHELIEEINLGYAVDGPRGLVVPVIDDIGERSLPNLAQRRHELVGKVLDDEYTAADLQKGTFTVTNVGVFGMDVSYSIINPPEVAILAVGRRKHAPVERDGDVAFEQVVTVSLTIDHRVLDGADSGAFLEQLAEYVEYPDAVLDVPDS